MILLLLALCFSEAQAAWDWTLNTSLRSYPLAAVLGAESGYNVLLWREDKVLYGYLRPSASAVTALSFNALSLQLDIFPVSFAGLRAGVSSEYNSADYAGLDCQGFECQGRTNRQFIQPMLALGTGDFFELLQLRFEKLSDPTPLRPFVEPTFNIRAATGEDHLSIYRNVLGYNLAPKHRVMLLSQFAATTVKHDTSLSHYAVFQREQGPWTWSVGAGLFRSELQSTGFSLLVDVSYGGGEPLSLF